MTEKYGKEWDLFKTMVLGTLARRNQESLSSDQVIIRDSFVDWYYDTYIKKPLPPRENSRHWILKRERFNRALDRLPPGGLEIVLKSYYSIKRHMLA